MLKPPENLAKGKSIVILKLNLNFKHLCLNLRRFELTPEEAGFGLNQFNLRDTILKETCPADPVCDQKTSRSPFRTLDGSCNNIKRSFWGKSRTQFQRALVPAYADGTYNILSTQLKIITMWDSRLQYICNISL